MVSQPWKSDVERFQLRQRWQIRHSVEAVDLEPLRPVDRLDDAALTIHRQGVREILAPLRIFDPPAPDSAEAERQVVHQRYAGSIRVGGENYFLALMERLGGIFDEFIASAGVFAFLLWGAVGYRHDPAEARLNCGDRVKLALGNDERLILESLV